MDDIRNWFDQAQGLAPLFAPVELFIMWLLYRKGKGKPLPQWLKRAKVFKPLDSPDRHKYWAGLRVFIRR